MPGSGPLFVDERDQRDLERLLADYRLGRLGRKHSDEEPKNRFTVQDATKIVALAGIADSDQPVQAIVLAPTTSRVYDVNCTGLFIANSNAPEQQTFPLKVRKLADERIVQIPFQATAEEFSAACGFDSDVQVWLGALFYPGVDSLGQSNARLPLYRWLVDVGDSGWEITAVDVSVWISMNGTGSPDVSLSRFTGTNHRINVQQPIPPPRFTNRQAVYADYSIDWDNDSSRWIVNFNKTPDEGMVISAFWDPQTEGWLHANIIALQEFAYNYASYPQTEDNYIYLKVGPAVDADPVAKPPNGAYRARVTWIYLNGKWREIYKELTPLQRAYLFGLWGWGGWGWNTGWGWGWGTGFEVIGNQLNNWQVPGCFALAHKSGSRWYLSSIEKRALNITTEP